jgi:luciferase-type oxidoreductase
MHNFLTGLDVLEPSSLPYASQPGFARTFRTDRLTLGLFLPIETFPGHLPSMQNQIERVRQAEALGFAAVWLRDIPLLAPNFGDVGQVYDPFVYLGYLAGQTREIALGTGAIVLPIRNPLHIAKQATSVDQLSGGRLLMGVASGDRPVEFPAFGVDADARGEVFRDHLAVIRETQRSRFKPLRWYGGSLSGADLIPKAVTEEVPILVTGSSRQSLEWIAGNAHGWITYPRPPAQQKALIDSWRGHVRVQAGETFKPFVQSLYLDLAERPDTPPQPIHLGLRMGRDHLIAYLELLQAMGVNHVPFNLRFGSRPVPVVLEEMRRHVLPLFRPHPPGSPAI